MISLPDGHYAERGEEYIFDECPACGGRKKFYWNEDLELGHCFSGSCGVNVRGLKQLRQLLESVGWDVTLPELLPRTAPPGKPPWAPSDLTHILDHPAGLLYLSKKKLDPSLALRCGLLVSPSSGEVYAPLSTPFPSLPKAYMARYVYEGRNLSWIFRHEGEGKGEKDHYFFCSPSFFRDHYAREWVVIVEGVGDLLKQPVVADNGIAVCGATLSPTVAQWLSKKCTRGVIVWGDNDPAGDELYNRAKKELRGWGRKARRFRTEEKDPGESLPLYNMHQFWA